MQQILFHLPFGIPIYGFGLMLFLTFLLVAVIWGPQRVRQIGMSRDKLQDMAILLFICGIAGARLVYMIQYRDQFQGLSVFELILAFFQIWNGGIVFYGSIGGGFLAYLAFYRMVLRPRKISGWKLADAVAPLLALGLAVGRLGCYLNGCCWGQPICEECQVVPLSEDLGRFPLLSTPARDQVIRPAGATARLPQIHGLQTSTGFAIAPGEPRPGTGDPRSVVTALEPGSQAAKAGLKVGDLIVEVNDEPNRIVVEAFGNPTAVDKVVKQLLAAGGQPTGEAETVEGDRLVQTVAFDHVASYQAAFQNNPTLTQTGVALNGHDTLWEIVHDPERGLTTLELVVERDGETVPIEFVPRTVAFFPTQLYETLSMGLLIFLMLSFQPFRRHDGQVMVVLMLGYAAHRFLNEAIRIEPTYLFGLTLSQLISIGIAIAALILELYLRISSTPLPKGALPLSYGVMPRPENGVKV